MNPNINETTVINYIRKKMMPIPYPDIITKFVGPVEAGRTREAVADQLVPILNSWIESGEVKHHNNYFYTCYLGNDMVEHFDFSILDKATSMPSAESFEDLKLGEVIKKPDSEHSKLSLATEGDGMDGKDSKASFLDVKQSSTSQKNSSNVNFTQKK